MPRWLKSPVRDDQADTAHGLQWQISRRLITFIFERIFSPSGFDGDGKVQRREKEGERISIP